MAKKELNFVQRFKNPEDFPYITNEGGKDISTHRMAAEVNEHGQWMVFPTIVQLPSGELHEFRDNFTAMQYAARTGEFLNKPNMKEATDYAKGGYKIGTPMETFNPLGIVE